MGIQDQEKWRLVPCGYSQIPGVDFTEHFAPLINDITWRILLVAMVIWKLDAWLIDVETAFQHGEFDGGEQIFMNLPVGYDLMDSSIDMSEDCIELMKTAYGTVQGERQWWKKFVSILKDIGFEGGAADPCLTVRWPLNRTSVGGRERTDSENQKDPERLFELQRLLE
ncbi:unnamed protein product [Cylindrotheca closterium]|uniref:Reverse transcriptase Ty1/copia-type domain-containing protein n=1 Tax=Cylindrotheca closterium TaxID=2856 RepID=A0AAD2CKC3_9STRA|nr:unnamed protein product [Cylindrotheca closterium]